MLSVDGTYVNSQGLEEIWIERRIYERLGKHPRICEYFGPVSRGIVLERLGYSLREYFAQLQKTGTIPSSRQALKWSVQAAEAIAYIHSRGIVQGDVGCYNFLLDNAGSLKLCDFGGSSIDGSGLKVGYATRSRLHRMNWEDEETPSLPAELFALGSTLYEIWTTRRPYEYLSNEEVETRYKDQQFPYLGDLLVGDVIRRCWLGKYTTATAVEADLKKLQKRTISFPGATSITKLFSTRPSSAVAFATIAFASAAVILLNLRRSTSK